MTRTKLNDEHWHKLFIILRQINVYNKLNRPDYIGEWIA